MADWGKEISENRAASLTTLTQEKGCSLKLALRTALHKVGYVTEFRLDTIFLPQIQKPPPKKPETSSNLG